MMPHSGVGGLTPRPIRKSGGIEDRPAEIERDLHRHGRQHVRQQEAQHDREVAVAAGARRFDPADIATDIYFRPCKADVERQIDDGGRDDDVLDPVAECGDHRHGQHKQRKGHHDVDEAANAAIEPAAGIAADRTDDGADGKGDSHRRDGDGEIEPRRHDKAAEHVASKLIGAGDVRRARWHQGLRHVRDDRIIRHDPRPENGDQRKQEDAGSGNGGERVAAQNPAGMAKRR
jgi:hypothetical protein